jgi:hypothetical protein
MSESATLKDARLLQRQPRSERETFDALAPTEIPAEGLQLGLVRISYGTSEFANPMKIDLCEYDDDSQFVEKNVLQSSGLHQTIDLRVDLSYPCKSVFFCVFAYPWLTVWTTAQFHAADGTVLREHIWRGDSESFAQIFQYVGEEHATYFTVTGGANLYIDNVDLTEPAALPGESVLENGDFEDLNSDAWHLSGLASIVDTINPPGEHHLELSSAFIEDASASQVVRLAKAGSYLLSFDLKNGFAEPLPARLGEVSLGTQTRNFAQASTSEFAMVFVFDITQEEIQQDLTLRIAKLQNNEPIWEVWFVDNVKLIPL